MQAKTTSIAGFWLLMAAAPLQTAAIALEDLSIGEQPPASTPSAYDTFNWEYVYNYKGASASAVDHYWILTAAHVADDGGTGNLVIDGTTYYQQEVVFHSKAADPDGNDSADLALVRYDKPLPGYYLLSTGLPVGSEVVVCGFGYPGAVITSLNSGYFTEDSAAGHATRRWGTNRIDTETTLAYTQPYASNNKGFDITISGTRSNEGKTLFEAGCNIFDSGGGMFVKDDGEWKLAGHMVVRYTSGSQFVGNFSVATKYYINWIKSVIVDYDTDMDGLPDWWETQYAGDATSMERDGHDDADGITNYEEWLADTVPIDANSFLAIGYRADAQSLSFDSSVNRQYQIQYRASLSDGNESWQVEVDWFTPDNTFTTVELSSGNSNRFLRVRARLP